MPMKWRTPLTAYKLITCLQTKVSANSKYGKAVMRMGVVMKVEVEETTGFRMPVTSFSVALTWNNHTVLPIYKCYSDHMQLVNQIIRYAIKVVRNMDSWLGAMKYCRLGYKVITKALPGVERGKNSMLSVIGEKGTLDQKVAGVSERVVVKGRWEY